MEPVYQYPNALDDLCGQVTPEQFTCLLSVLSSSDSSKSTFAEIDNDFSNNTSSFQGTSLSGSSRQSLSEDDKARDLEILRNKSIGYYEKQFEKFTLPPGITKPSGRPSLLQLSSFDSTDTQTKSGEDRSSFSRFGVTSKDSMLALKGVTALEENLAENLYLAETKYSQFPLPLLDFRGEKLGDDAQILTDQKHLSCFHLPVCKRIMGKCMMGGERKSRSRSSSVESVLAETLPDLDNPLAKIAGKIANEPVHHFPVLRKANSKKSSYSTATSTSKRSSEGKGKVKSNVHRIEQEFTRELDKFQDFKDVSDFFSHPKRGSNTKKSSGGYNLSKRVSNPLYKEYDPTGYHKNEDELALECMQMICDDFNKWIQSLSDHKKRKSSIEDEEESSEIQHEAQVIDSEFLIQILRTEMELPE